MTLSVSQDIAYPVVGQIVKLSVIDYAIGNRARLRVISAPSTSTVKLYTVQNPNWLDDGKLSPDVEGKYVLEAVEEQFTGHVPHYSNDQGTTGAIDTWSEVTANTVAYNVYVGCEMKRTLGIAPDQVTLRLYCHDSDSTSGILTAFYDETLAPRLEEPTSDRAKVALGAPAVAESLARIGGKGYSGTDSILGTAGLVETSAIMSPFYYSVSYPGLISELKDALNSHLDITSSNSAHGAVDSTNAVTAGAATTPATLYTLLTQIKAKYSAHIGTVGGVHALADTVYTISSPDANSEASAITLANELRTQYESHRAYVAHYTPGDGVAASRISVQACWDIESCYLLANDIKSKYNSHRLITEISAEYHAAADLYNDATLLPEATDGASLIIVTNELADLVNAHVSNIKNSDNTTVGFHGSADTGSALGNIPRASTEEEAIALVDQVAYCFTRHVDTQGPWHGATGAAPNGCTPNPGRGLAKLWGVSKLNYDFTSATKAADLGGPPNGLVSQTQLIAIGGFSKP